MDERFRLLLGDDVPGDDVHPRGFTLDVGQHPLLVNGVPLRGVHHQNVDAGFHQGVHAVPVFIASADGGPAKELLGGVLAGVGEVQVLQQVAASQERH